MLLLPRNKEKAITARLLRTWPLPIPEEGDKEARGRVLVVGGAPQMPGAVILAANAALRAGAGKLQIATCESIAPFIGTTVPEALVLGLPQSASGALAPHGAISVASYARNVAALLIGPGMIEDDGTATFVQNILAENTETTIVLDAVALKVLTAVPTLLHAAGGAILTPHAGEMAGMLELEKQQVIDNPLRCVREAAQNFQAVVALKGAQTFIAAPDGEVYCNTQGNVGLATSGSGDTLAGVIAGLAARGADPLQATVWGVFLHARAGDRLAKRIAALGFLARELLAEVPVVMAGLSEPHPGRKKKR
ncbi:MAG: NAD(P)H-hydrate dehydratase [Candidatus Eremiobacteraeota bacterium]|nr:NAD(P)H-hydrate dehydratase [Candidatus Eremiobacteraeota bacterium]